MIAKHFRILDTPYQYNEAPLAYTLNYTQFSFWSYSLFAVL